MKFMKRAFGEFHEFHMRFCLSYDPFKWDLIAYNINIISARKRIVDMDVVNDIMSTCQSVITHMVIQFL